MSQYLIQSCYVHSNAFGVCDLVPDVGMPVHVDPEHRYDLCLDSLNLSMRYIILLFRRVDHVWCLGIRRQVEDIWEEYATLKVSPAVPRKRPKTRSRRHHGQEFAGCTILRQTVFEPISICQHRCRWMDEPESTARHRLPFGGEPSSPRTNRQQANSIQRCQLVAKAKKWEGNCWAQIAKIVTPEILMA